MYSLKPIHFSSSTTVPNYHPVHCAFDNQRYQQITEQTNKQVKSRNKKKRTPSHKFATAPPPLNSEALTKENPQQSTMASIPTSASVHESTVIEAPLSKVWHYIKLGEIGSFWSAIKSSEVVKGTSPETDVVQWVFQDGTEIQVKQEEHSVSNSSAQCIFRINQPILSCIAHIPHYF